MARRSFTREFKCEAVRQVGQKGRTVASVARDLGVSAHTLSRWRQELSEGPESAFPGKGRLRPEEHVGRPTAALPHRHPMPDVVIENPILNSPYEQPRRRFRFGDDGITARWSRSGARAVGSTRAVDVDTSKQFVATRPDRCHVSHVVAGSHWETRVAGTIEALPRVRCFVKNQGLGFTIP